jgi:hypothetical protein
LQTLALVASPRLRLCDINDKIEIVPITFEVKEKVEEPKGIKIM